MCRTTMAVHEPLQTARVVVATEALLQCVCCHHMAERSMTVPCLHTATVTAAVSRRSGGVDWCSGSNSDHARVCQRCWKSSRSSVHGISSRQCHHRGKSSTLLKCCHETQVHMCLYCSQPHQTAASHHMSHLFMFCCNLNLSTRPPSLNRPPGSSST
jgi:hypothetical protein